MLKLTGNHAAIMLVAKGGLNDIPVPQVMRLKCAVALMAGLSNPDWVTEGDLVGIVAELHDILTDAKLLRAPANSIAETFKRSTFMSAMKAQSLPTPLELLLQSLTSNFTTMRVRAEDGEQLVDYQTDLPEDFKAALAALSKLGQAPDAPNKGVLGPVGDLTMRAADAAVTALRRVAGVSDH